MPGLDTGSIRGVTGNAVLSVGGLARDGVVHLGATVEAAAGKAFDKVARLLDLGFPGGPALDRVAREGDPGAIAFPRGMTGPRDSRHDFSFSGLKTAVARYVEKCVRDGVEVPVADVAASFQEAVADVLTMKAVRAATDLGVSTLLIAGGVAANSRVRALADQDTELKARDDVRGWLAELREVEQRGL